MGNDRFQLYLQNENNTARFYLGTCGEKTLLVCGLNPSTATKEKSDQTISKVINYAKNNGYDSFLMINLYPLRSTEPSSLPYVFDESLHKKNIAFILKLLKNIKKCDLLVCWGNNILIRDYLNCCMIDLLNGLKNSTKNYYQLGDLTVLGHPRHPSRISYAVKLKKFNKVDYIKNKLTSVE